MRAFVSAFWTPKSSSSTKEYEDAFALGPYPFEGGDFDGARFSVAVADGATSALLSGRWASLLTQRFVDSAHGDLSSAITVAAAEWAEVTAAYLEERLQRGSPIQWYEEPGLEKGAYSTLVGSRFRDEDPYGLAGSFEAWAVGDSCLFQVRDDELICTFPLDSADSFTFQPNLVPSRLPDQNKLNAAIEYTYRSWQSGDQIYIATDALACWFLREFADQQRPWQSLRDLDTSDGPASFEEWVAAQRHEHAIQDDDTTLVRVDIH